MVWYKLLQHYTNWTKQVADTYFALTIEGDDSKVSLIQCNSIIFNNCIETSFIIQLYVEDIILVKSIW